MYKVYVFCVLIALAKLWFTTATKSTVSLFGLNSIVKPWLILSIMNIVELKQNVITPEKSCLTHLQISLL